MSPCRGFSLIEVLMSLFILSLVLLGLNAMQIYALRESAAAYYFSQATIQMNSMIERLSLNHDLQNQINIWNQQNQEVLPNGRGVVTGSYLAYTLTIFWGEISKETVCASRPGKNIKCLSQTVML